MSYYQTCAIPKPEPRKRSKRRKDRQEKAVKTTVREQCVERDGYCLIATRLPAGLRAVLGPCSGPSEWAHVGTHRRFRTRGQAPESRHTVKGSGMLCEKHHKAYDAHRFDIDTDDREGMNRVVGIVRRAA